MQTRLGVYYANVSVYPKEEDYIYTRYPRVTSAKLVVTEHIHARLGLSFPLSALLEIRDLVFANLTTFAYELPYTSGFYLTNANSCSVSNSLDISGSRVAIMRLVVCNIGF